MIIVQNLTVLVGAGNTGTTPVLGIDEVGSLKCFHLVILYRCVSGKGGIQLVTLRMGDDKVYIGSVHPLGKAVRYGLRKGTGMGRPGQHHLGTRLALVFLNGDEVGKCLERMHGGCLHGEDGTAAILEELVIYGFGIVILSVCQSGKGTDSDEIAVRAHHRDGFQEVFATVAIHDDPTLGLQFPRSGIHIKHNDIHAQVHCRLLCGETGAQTVIEKHHQQGLVLAQMLPLETVLLYLYGLLQSLVQIAEVLYVQK